MTLPTAVLRRRSQDAAVREAAMRAGYSSLQAQLLAARVPARYIPNLRQHIEPTLAQLDPPDRLPDIAIITRLIADAVMDPNGRVGLVLDHDVDGSAGGAVLRTALITHFGMAPERVGYVLSHKRKEGFGVSTRVVERLLQEFPPPALLVTVDQGSQDGERFVTLREHGYVVACTDHHHIDQVPQGAVACVNPSRHDAVGADPRISGCFVAWLVACAVRRELIARGHLPADAPSLASLLDLVAASVTADATSVAQSTNNRAALRYGLRRMNHAPRPAWQALREVMGKDGPLDEQDIGFGIGPHINSVSRMGDAAPIVEFLCTDDLARARELAAFAHEQNQQRKQVEKRMLEQALEQAEPQVEAGRHAIVVYLDDGSSAIHGVVASRIVDRTGRPALCLSPKYGEEGVLTGSLRSVPAVNILQALTKAAALRPGCVRSFGGHPAAGGVVTWREQVPHLADAFNEAVGQQADLRHAVPVVWTDGELGQAIDGMLLEQIQALAPYGREFEPPCFELIATVRTVRTLGDGSHLRLELIDAAGRMVSAVWFGAQPAGQAPCVQPGHRLHLAVRVVANHFRGRVRVETHVQWATRCDAPHH